MSYDPHIIWEKTGTDICNRCGRCCDQNCEHFSWQVIKTGAGLKTGTSFQAGQAEGNVIGVCAIFDQDVVAANGCTLDQRRNFPYDPWQVPKKCAFTNWRPKEIPLEP